MNKKIEAYKEIQKVVNKHKEYIDHLDFSDLADKIRRMEVSELFGIPLSGHGTSFNVERAFDDWTRVSLYGEKHNRTISWSDNGKQPEDEWLYCICFPIGAYIFGGQYPTETFNTFFQELKNFGAKYCDTVNHCLYFIPENAKEVYDNFWPIFNKYKSMVGEELKQKRKKELEEELAKLQ